MAAQRIARDRAQLARGDAEEIVRDEYAKRGLVIDADAVLEFANWLHRAPDWWLRHWHGDAFEGGQIIDTITPKNRRLRRERREPQGRARVGSRASIPGRGGRCGPIPRGGQCGTTRR